MRCALVTGVQTCAIPISVMIGPGDSFIVPLRRLLRRLPVFALFGNGGTRLQPPHVDDVARAISGVFTVEAPAKIYELGGPQIYTYRSEERRVGQESVSTCRSR